jgi:hypothetical protein
MTPGSAAARARAGIGPGGNIDRVDLLANDAAVQTLIPGAGSPGPGSRPDGPVWLVRLHGTFTGTHAPSSHTGAGYYVIDDTTGQVVELGW